MHRRHFFEQLAAIIPVPLSAAQVAVENGPPPDFPPWLAAWRSLPQQPVWSWDDLRVRQLITAAKAQKALRVRYLRGSTPGELRQFTPAMVFRTAEHPAAPLYVNGWCHQRQQHRTLRLDHLVLCASIS